MSKLTGFDYYLFFNCFYIYSFLGWVMECIVLSIQDKTFVKNTGFVRGPFCTIYGAGALGAYFILKPVSENIVVLFICGMALATLLEYVTAVVMTRLFGDFWWDYDNKPFNYKGILCLESSLGWGFLTVLLFHLFQPLVESIVSLYPVSLGKIAVTIISIVYFIDFTTSFRKSHKAFIIARTDEDDTDFEVNDNY